MLDRVTPVVILASAIAVSGCAFGARHVNLTYGERLIAQGIKPTRGTVAVARFTDGRVDGTRNGMLLGKVRNGYGVPTASVLANQDPILWVNDGVARALTVQGFAVQKVESAARSNTQPTVTGIVTRASGGMYMSMDANVAADLAVERGGVTIGTLHCEGRATKVAWTASADEYRVVFERAMDEFADNCAPGLVQLLWDKRQ